MMEQLRLHRDGKWSYWWIGLPFHPYRTCKNAEPWNWYSSDFDEEDAFQMDYYKKMQKRNSLWH